MSTLIDVVILCYPADERGVQGMNIESLYLQYILITSNTYGTYGDINALCGQGWRTSSKEIFFLRDV